MVIVAVTVYSHLRARASERVKAEIVKVADIMALSPEMRAELTDLLEAAHEEAFNKALDLKRKHGQKFDERLYFDEIFTGVVSRARASGMHDLADTVEREREHITFAVTEK
jgi:hypothetical protein